MPEETVIKAEHIEDLLTTLADNVINGLFDCMGKGWQKWARGEPEHKFKPHEFADVERAAQYVVSAVQTGLLLAKRQPSSVDVLFRNWKAGGPPVDEFWRGIMEVYQNYLEYNGSKCSPRDRIFSGHFSEFLPFWAVGWLRLMAVDMDKGWQKAWHKSIASPHKLKPAEKNKIDSVGNSVVGAIVIGLVIARRQPELLDVDWSRGASLDALWEGMLFSYKGFLYYTHFVSRRPY